MNVVCRLIKCVLLQCKVPAQPASAELPEIEKCFPYDPSGKTGLLFHGFKTKLLTSALVNSVPC